MVGAGRSNLQSLTLVLSLWERERRHKGRPRTPTLRAIKPGYSSFLSELILANGAPQSISLSSSFEERVWVRSRTELQTEGNPSP